MRVCQYRFCICNNTNVMEFKLFIHTAFFKGMNMYHECTNMYTSATYMHCLGINKGCKQVKGKKVKKMQTLQKLFERYLLYMQSWTWTKKKTTLAFSVQAAHHYNQNQSSWTPLIYIVIQNTHRLTLSLCVCVYLLCIPV